MDYRIVVLGSAQDGGSPQMGFHAPIGPPRTAASIAVLDGNGNAALFDASPDLRLQQRSLVDLDLAYRRRGGNPFDAVFLTHAHMGHYVGLAQFGKEAANTRSLPLHVTSSMATFLVANDPWARIITDGHLEIHTLDGGEVEPLPGLTVTPVPVPHRADHTDTVGFSIRTRDSRALYLPDIDGWDSWRSARDVLSRHDLIIVDGTFSSAEELPDRDIAATPHPYMADTIDRFGDLASRIVFTHLNRSNRASDPTSSEAAAVVAAGFQIAHDGMVLPQ
jgi:pyrroloquinoline quinone biosynthesis protein B